MHHQRIFRGPRRDRSIHLAHRQSLPFPIGAILDQFKGVKGFKGFPGLDPDPWADGRTGLEQDRRASGGIDLSAILRVGDPMGGLVGRFGRPFILETPGMDEGYDLINLERARALLAGESLDPLPPAAFTLRRSRPSAAAPRSDGE